MVVADNFINTKPDPGGGGQAVKTPPSARLRPGRQSVSVRTVLTVGLTSARLRATIQMSAHQTRVAGAEPQIIRVAGCLRRRGRRQIRQLVLRTRRPRHIHIN
jgi:hypothetical protein